jgi:hypothetical protein
MLQPLARARIVEAAIVSAECLSALPRIPRGPLFRFFGSFSAIDDDPGSLLYVQLVPGCSPHDSESRYNAMRRDSKVAERYRCRYP